MRKEQAKALLANRTALVAAHRAHPGSWPDGIDSKYDRWFVPEHWNEKGEFAGPKGWFDTSHPDPGIEDVTKNADVTESPAADVTESRKGRPKSESALTATERKRRQRERGKEPK
jgi:hypothetical protein